MAWNQSNNGAANVPRKDGGKSSGLVHGLIAGGVVVVIGVLAIYFLSGESENRPSPKSVKPAAEVTDTPAEPVAPKKVEAPKPKPIDPNARPTRIGEVVNGYVLLPSGRLHKRQGVVTNSVALRAKGKFEIFDHDTDNEIAGYLSLEPGETIIGDRDFDERFVQEFLESLKTPIIVTKDDNEYQAQLKRMVIDARKSMKEAYDNGEDICKLMKDTREEMQDMMRYRMQLESQFHEYRNKEALTDQDVEDMFDACNKVLEKKGIAPIRFGPITRIRMKNLK